MGNSDTDDNRAEGTPSPPGTASAPAAHSEANEELPTADAGATTPSDNTMQPSTTPPEINLRADATENAPAQNETSSPSTGKVMELHHSHHHPRKWKDYLFEFLMLFLAVTAGFFVENKRETYVEHERAAQFSRQLLADLRSDSLLFENRNRTIQAMQKGYTNMMYLLTQKPNTSDKEILETLLPLSFVFDFPTTATTYNQMKTSGALRYIENEDLVVHLRDCYDVLLPRCYRIAQASLDYYSAHINPYYLKHIRIQDYDPFEDTLTNKNALIMERTAHTDQELANIMGGYWSLLKIQLVSMNQPALEKIKETMVILKREYELL